MTVERVFFQQYKEYTSGFYIVLTHRSGTCRWKSSSWKTRICLFYLKNTMATGGLATHDVSAWAAMALSLFAWNGRFWQYLSYSHINPCSIATLIARFMGPTWAHLGSTGPRWAPCWPHEPCYLGNYILIQNKNSDFCGIKFVWLHFHTFQESFIPRCPINNNSKCR